MLTPAQFAFFTTATNTMLGAVYDSTPVLYPRFSSTVPSDGDQNVYGWTGRTPKPRAWYGPRVVNEPAPQTYTLANVPFENTIKIDRFRLDDARARGDIYWRTMPDLALQSKRSMGSRTGRRITRLISTTRLRKICTAQRHTSMISRPVVSRFCIRNQVVALRAS